MSMTLNMAILGKYMSKVFVETGTYDGRGSIAAVFAGYQKVHTIEVDAQRVLMARKRLMGFPEVEVYYGDTIDILPRILDGLEERATIFLDAHPIGFGDPSRGGRIKYPLVEELRLIKLNSKRKDHSILIDDVNAFKYWSATIEEISKMLLEINPAYLISMEPNSSGALDMMGARLV